MSGILFCTSDATEDAVKGTLSLTSTCLLPDDERAGGEWLRDVAGLRTSDDLSRPPRRTCRYMRGGRLAHALDPHETAHLHIEHTRSVSAKGKSYNACRS